MLTDNLFDAMDYVTGDDTGTDYFRDKHCNIINENFPGTDWSWAEVIEYWPETDMKAALKIYEEQQ